jgi:hypothetical protein
MPRSARIDSINLSCARTRPSRSSFVATNSSNRVAYGCRSYQLTSDLPVREVFGRNVRALDGRQMIGLQKSDVSRLLLFEVPVVDTLAPRQNILNQARDKGAQSKCTDKAYRSVPAQADPPSDFTARASR